MLHKWRSHLQDDRRMIAMERDYWPYENDRRESLASDAYANGASGKQQPWTSTNYSPEPFSPDTQWSDGRSYRFSALVRRSTIAG